VARLVTSLIRRPWFMGLVTGLENTEFDKSSSPLTLHIPTDAVADYAYAAHDNNNGDA